MPAQTKGEVSWTSVGAVVRIVVGKRRQRRTFELPTCRTEAEAVERGALLANLARRFRRAGVIDKPGAIELLELAAASAPALLEGVLRVAGELVGGEFPGAAQTPVPTFAELSKRWTSGELHRDYRTTSKRRTQRWTGVGLDFLEGLDVGGVKLGEIPLHRFTLDHAEAAMRQLPESAQRPATRRHYGLLVNRVLSLAVYPCRLIPANPLPRGFLPKAGKPPAFPYLYPAEDAALLACIGSPGKSGVPLARRVLFAFLAREGCRISEAASLTFADIDLERGAVTLDENKTDDPRAWALDPGVTEALRRWKKLRGAALGR